METLYLTGSPTTLSIGPQGFKIVNGKESTTIPPPAFGYDHVIIQRARGYISLDALRMLQGQRVSIALLDWRGRLLGQFVPYARRTGDLWMRQFQAAANPKRRLALARTIVTEAGLRRGLNVKTYTGPRTVAGLVLTERRATKAYWTGWRKRLSEIWPGHDFSMRGHPLHPIPLRAVSYVNAVLNYGYSLLEASARTVCHRVGLRPEIGFLHSSTNPEKEPMVYDLQEYGRGWVDSAVLDWFRERENRRGYFRAPDWTVTLSPDRARALVTDVAPAIQSAQLLRDARKVADRL